MPMGLKLGRASASPMVKKMRLTLFLTLTLTLTVTLTSASPMVKKTMPVTRPAEATYSRKEYLRPSSSVPTCSVREAEALGRW